MGSNLAKAVTAREFIPPVHVELSAEVEAEDAAALSLTSPAAWYQSEEWKGHATYWHEKAAEAGKTAERYKEQVDALSSRVVHLAQTAEHYKQKSVALGQQLGFCTQVIQTHSDDRKKEVTKLMDQITVLKDENTRLASLLNTSLLKAESYDQLVFSHERLSEDRDQLRTLVDSMTSALSGFMEREGSGDSRDRALQFSASFFASPPVDGHGCQ